MRSCPFPRRTALLVALAGLLPLAVGLGRAADEDTPAKDTPETRKQGITLQACRAIALEHQPSLAAARATLKATLDRASALDNLRVCNLLAPDLPVRRKQAALGVTIAQGGVTQAEAEAVYAVTYSYLAALYARQQVRIAEEQIRPRIQGLSALVSDAAIRKGRRDVILNEHVNFVNSFLQTLSGRSLEATEGEKRALAALREAMGVGPEFPLELPQRALPCPRVEPRLSELVALGLARRGEVIQANTFAAVVCLEADAQATSNRPSLRTFASGSDIHGKLIPSGPAGSTEYRPTAVAPEMPPTLSGSKCARIQQAHDYCQRAEAMAAKTRNLVALEVEDIYRRWLDRSQRAAYLELAYRESLIFSDKLKEAFNPKMPAAYPNVDEIINAGLVTTRLQLEWKEAHYQALLALAALERATSGGFAVDFDAAPDCPQQPEALPEVPKEKP